MKSRLVWGAVPGAAWVLAFAPFSWWWVGLGLPLLVPLMLRRDTPQSAFWLGLGFGTSAFAVGVHWLYVSLNHYGGLPAPLAVLSIAVFALYLGLYTGLASALYVKFRAPGAPLLNAALWAALWTLAEWCRSTLFTGFAWLNLGDALVDSPFAVLLPWLGGSALSFLLLWMGGLLVSILLAVVQRERVSPLALVGLLTLGVGLSILGPQRPVTHTSGYLDVAGVQTNVDQSIKFDPDRIVSNMQQAFELGDLASQQLPEGGLLVFPETVNPLVWADTPNVWRERFRDFAKPGHTGVLMGSATQDGYDYFNSIVLLRGQETGEALLVPTERHDKRHLVPFGEFIPWGFQWFVSLMNIPLGEFSRGSGPLRTLEFNGQRMAATVCYEDIFSSELVALIQSADHEPTVLVNLSNLAWFGQTWALDQHAQIGRTRSAELAKPGLRVTNTGLSGVVGPDGQWLTQAERGQAVVWRARIEGRKGATLFSRIGTWLWWTLCALALGAAFHRITRVRPIS
ncbi:MAG: apolipoprotein N-acyltransferase [Limnobacter sp.]|uniref:apolipoprotein N-acyltransferase n=1 Tax=Limnobacter sp. TaxID=2003368 RepID=UPI00391CB0ED